MRIGLSKRERLELVLQQLEAAAPFATYEEARSTLEQIMRCIEDDLSGIPENPDAATSPTDGRMYPPNDKYAIPSGSPQVHTFKQRGHRTSFGDNGAVKITFPDGTVVVDLPGADGKTVADLLLENQQ